MRKTMIASLLGGAAMIGAGTAGANTIGPVTDPYNSGSILTVDCGTGGSLCVSYIGTNSVSDLTIGFFPKSGGASLTDFVTAFTNDTGVSASATGGTQFSNVGSPLTATVNSLYFGFHTGGGQSEQGGAFEYFKNLSGGPLSITVTASKPSGFYMFEVPNTPVPLPAALPLVLAGLGALGIARTVRRRA